MIVSFGSDLKQFLFLAKSLVHAWPLDTARGGQGVLALGGGSGADACRATQAYFDQAV